MAHSHSPAPSDKHKSSKTNPQPASSPAHESAAPVGAAGLQRAMGRPLSASPDQIVQLQRQFGNRLVRRLIQRAQSKIAEPPAAIGAEGGEVQAGIQSQINAAQGGGQPLDRSMSARMGSAIGADFNGVRVHTDARSDTLNRALSAQAFTLGTDVYFSKGAYNPGTHTGQQLLAHELTHVVQQGGATNKVQTKLTVGPAGDRYEEEADQVAGQVMRHMSTSGPAVRTGRQRVQRKPNRAGGLIQRSLVGDMIGGLFSRKQKYKDVSAKPERTAEYRQEADEFEKRLGYYIYNHPKALNAAQVAIARMKDALIGNVKDDNPMYKQAVMGAFGRSNKESAGQVGQDFDKVMAMLGGGNLRELMTAFYNSSLEGFKKVVSQIMKAGDWDKANDRGLDVGALKARKKQQGIGDADLFLPVGHPLKTSSSEFFWTNLGQGLNVDRWRGRRYQGKTSERTAGDLEQGYEQGGTTYGAPLSEREQQLMYGKKDDVSKDKLTWKEGGTFWKVNETSKWFKDIRGKMGMPVTAGPSGTTDRLFDVYKYLKVGVPAEDFRLALLGWMMTSNDHSFHEIMTIARKKVPSLAYQTGPLSYRYISPLTISELRANVCKDKMFPDEIIYTKKMRSKDYSMYTDNSLKYPEEVMKKDPKAEKDKDSEAMLEHVQSSGLAGAVASIGYTGAAYQVQNPAAEGGTGMMARLKVAWQMRKNAELRTSAGGTAFQKGDASIKDLLKESKVHNRFLQQALLEMPDWHGTVFRGETARNSNWYADGKAVNFQKFTSTSGVPSVAKNFADKGANAVKVIWEIKTNTGKYIAPFSRLPGEKEVLLPPGSVVKITGTPQMKDFKDIAAGRLSEKILNAVTKNDTHQYLHVKAVQTGGAKSLSGKKIGDLSILEE